MADRFKRNIFTIAGVFAGAVAGFLYWKFIGCASGTCPLTSSWKIMLVYGGITGGLLGNTAQGFVKKKETAK
ncbi:MAG: DUF6132 family protein [Ignavibacteria bacterium]|nr:DUF6132 family protein [Ignavibacteria bacterium]